MSDDIQRYPSSLPFPFPARCGPAASCFFPGRCR